MGRTVVFALNGGWGRLGRVLSRGGMWSDSGFNRILLAAL